MHKILPIALLTTGSLFFIACGDNPIESANERNSELFLDKDKLVAQMDEELQNADFYACKQKYGETRCNNFKAKYGSYDCPEIADKYYNDNGDFVNPFASSSSSSEMAPASSSEEPSTYLLENKMLNVTLQKYQQIKDKITSSDSLGDLDISFTVTTFSDGVKGSEKTLYALENETDVYKWTKEIVLAFPIIKGIDSLIICPKVVDLNEESEDIVLSSNKCTAISKLGQMKPVESATVNDENSRYYNMTWSWELFTPKK